ncbi:hypothetical protein NBRC116599_13190 [Aquicoccus sp. SU-CL01552]
MRPELTVTQTQLGALSVTFKSTCFDRLVNGLPQDAGGRFHQKRRMGGTGAERAPKRSGTGNQDAEGGLNGWQFDRRRRYFCPILLSVPARMRAMFSRWRQ